VPEPTRRRLLALEAAWRRQPCRQKAAGRLSSPLRHAGECRLQRLVHVTQTSAQLGPRASDLRWTAAKRGHILTHRSSAAWFVVCAASAHYRLPRAESWRQAGPLCTPPICVTDSAMESVGGACGLAVSCPQQHSIGATAGRCTRPHVDDASTVQSIPEGAASRVPGLCERFNGLRDPNMTPARGGRICYSRIVTHPGRLWNFATTSCSSQVHTTPKSAKGNSCSLNSAGKRSITSPP
jgi:hypothetical protein